MTLHLWPTPRSVAFWSLPSWTEDLDLIVARLTDENGKLVVWTDRINAELGAFAYRHLGDLVAREVEVRDE